MKASSPLTLSVSAVLAFGQVGDAARLLSPQVDPSIQPGAELRTAVSFIENLGQWNTPARYLGRLPGLLVRVEDNALVLQLYRGRESSRGVLVKLTFEGSSEEVALVGQGPLPGRHHFFVGDDPTKWQRNVPAYQGLCHRRLYDGVDLILRTDGGRLKYDLALEPGADLSQVTIRCEGTEGLRIDPQGNLCLDTVEGTLQHPMGRAWQRDAFHGVEEVQCRFRLVDEQTFGFEAVDWDPSLPLVIDPMLLWSTYLGSTMSPGGLGDIAWDADIQPNGDLTVVGQTGSPDFPTTPGAYQATSTGSDVFVSRLSGSDGSLIYSSIIGSSLGVVERAVGVAVDLQGRATVVGWTGAGFPTTPRAYSSVPAISFVLRLTCNGDDLSYSTFLGGSGIDEVQAVAVTQSGAAIVGGRAGGLGDFPTTGNAYDPVHNGSGDGFLTRLDPAGSSLEWSTFLGGIHEDKILDLAVDDSGDVTVVGRTQSPNFPTTPGAFDQSFSGSIQFGEVFVSRMNRNGTALIWSTLLGDNREDVGHGIALHPDGGVVVVGRTHSLNFPTTPGVLQEDLNSANNWPDAFAARLNVDGSSLVFSTFLGGLFPETAYDVAIDSIGRVTIVGSTNSNDFPITQNAFDTSWNGSSDIFLCRLNPTASDLIYSTYIGSSGPEDGFGLAMRNPGRVAIVGVSHGSDYPTTLGAAQPRFQGGQSDAVVTTFLFEDVQSPDVSSIPRRWSGAIASVTLAGSDSDKRLELSCHGPAETEGWVLLGWTDGKGHVREEDSSTMNPELEVVRLPVRTDASGYARASVPLRPEFAGQLVDVQFVLQTVDGGPAAASQVVSNIITISIP